jgi:hypothetical protein
MTEIPSAYVGWWRITETSQWVNEHLDDLGPALISITGRGDRLRLLALLAYVNWTATTSGLKFVWTGAWEFDPMTGTGTVKLGKDGKLKGTLRIRQGDSSTFVAEKTTAPERPIPDPPSYRDKWSRSHRW